MRGLPGSWDRGIETFRRLRGIRTRNFQVVVGMTLFAKNASLGRCDDRRHSGRDPGLQAHGAAPEYRPRVGALLRQRRAICAESATHPVAEAIEAHRTAIGNRLHPVRFLEDRYQALVGRYYETHKSPLPCTALSSSCFIDPYWKLYPCSIWDESLGNLRENGLRSLAGSGNRQRTQGLRERRSSTNNARTAGRRARRTRRFSAISRRPSLAGSGVSKVRLKPDTTETGSG